MKTERTHDNFYLNEDRYDNVKESFKFILEKSFDKDELESELEVCDLGCATGEFLYFLKSKATSINVHGLDVMSKLIDKAIMNIPGGKFKSGSVLDRTNYKKLFSGERWFYS